MEVLDLFSGVGGFSKAAEAMGWRVVAHCEWADYPTQVLKKRWPNVPHFHDVTELTADHLKAAGVTKVDLITGGFPCQDVSLAGRRAGLGPDGAPTRSGLFREIVRLSDELDPSFIVMENVQGILSGGLDYVAATFADRGWTFEWRMIPASAVGAPHQRNRIWMVCHKGAPFMFGAGTGLGHRMGDGYGMGGGSLFGDADPIEVMPKCGYAIGDAMYEVAWSKYRPQPMPWPTPRACSAKGPSQREIDLGDPKCRLECSVAVNWPTPMARDFRSAGDPNGKRAIRKREQGWTFGLNEEAAWESQDADGQTGALNPDWEDTLMGYPIGWTDVDCDEPTEVPCFPMGRGPEQHDWEPPRLTTVKKNRAPRVKALGNGIVWQVALSVFRLIERPA